MNFKDFKEKCHKPKLRKMKGSSLYRFERNISIRISWFLVRSFSKIKPNFITIISLLILLIMFFVSFLKDSASNVYISLLQLIFLYFITILDKIDGEIARHKNYCTQKGMYYDYTVHFFYPFVFYFIIGHFFYFISGNITIFFITILLSVLNINLVAFKVYKIYIGDRIKKDKINIQDFIPNDKKVNKKRLPWPLRLIVYLTFMIYEWTLFYYIAVILISTVNYEIAYYMYLIQILVSISVISYRVFYSNPKNSLFRKNILYE